MSSSIARYTSYSYRVLVASISSSHSEKNKIMVGTIEAGADAQPASPSRLSIVQEIGLALVVVLLAALLNLWEARRRPG
jgi:hypothetical protein